MLIQSKETRDAWRASQRTLDIKVTIDGKTYGATDINSLKYDSGAYNGDTFAIGSTYSNTVQIEFSHLVEGLKLGMEVRPSIGIKTSSGYIYEPLGVFIISSEIKMDRNNNLTTVSASDRFCGLEGAYVSKLTYPAKALDVIAEICAQSGVKANTNDLARLPHQEDLPAPITGQSYRKALGWIAQLYVGYALFDRQGLFTIRTISEPNYELDPSQYEQAGLTKNEAAYKINGIQCQVTLTTKTRDGESTEETKNYQAGDATGSQIKLENNIMTPQRLNDIWEQLKDITFYPFSLNWFGNPAVEAGDWLRLEDKQGNSFVVPNSSYTLDFNGGLSATSKADQTTSSDQMVPWQGSVAQTIKELQLRRLPDGTVVFPPSVTESPTNAKFNDVWFKKNGNSTELWIFEKQDDGAGKWIRKDLSDDEIKKKVADAQQGLNQAKADIIANKQKADTDIENLNKSIEANKKVADQDIQNLNKSIADNKKVADDSLQKLSDSITKLQGQYDNNIVPDLTKVTNDVADALQKYISAQNNIADLTKQAQAQGKNIADVTNTVKGLNINYANLAGDVNSTKADVKGIQTTLGNANGDIAQLKLDAQNLQTMLAGKVDNTTYTNFVNLTNQALNARLTASDLNGYAKTADVQATANGLQVNINSVNGKLDNLVIGGRNLVRNSGFPKNADYWNGVERATHDFYYTKKQPLFLIKANTTEERLGSSTYFPLKRNTDYVVSFKGFASVNVSSYDIFILARKYGETNSYSSIKHLIDAKRLSGSSVQYVKDLVFNSGENDEAYFRIDNNGSSDGRDAWLFFTEVKVEEGNKSTAWTPAPEDERQRVDNITSQLSARITATSQQFSSYYTKAETDNRTNSAKNDAINSIKNDGNWQGLSNILTNSGFLQTADGFLQKVQQTAQPMIDANNGGGINLVKMSGFHNVTIDQLMPCWNIGNDIFINTKGGRNATGSIVIDARNISDSLREFTQWIDLEPNTDYHLSFHLLFVELAANSSFSAYTYLTEYDDQGNTTYPYRDNGRLIVNTNDRSQNSFTIHTGNTTKKGLLYVRAMKGTKIELEEIKLEKGHIGTPWSPAPSDFATQISFSELSQSLDGLRSTVGSNYGNLQSQISQSSSAVRTELNDRINGVDNKTTSTANSLNSVIGRVGSLENLTNIQIINSAINANDYTNTGNYFIQSTDNINVPGTNWCYLKVEKVNDGRIIQTWQADSDPTLRFIRTKFGDSWTNWQRAASYSEYSELNRTVQGLQSTVSSNHSDLQSQISQTAKNIRQEVSDKTGGLQTQINQQANDFNVSLNSLRNETAWQKVTSAIDANNYKTTGNYWIQATPNSNTPDSSAWAYLQVVASPDAKRIKQTWQRDNNENEIYTRLLIEDIWTSWQRTVTGGNIMAQINMSAGTTLIQNDKIYMDASSTIFSGKAFIPDAAITNISADKITAGTLDAGRINVINLNANNITAGTLRGSNGEFYLDSGALHVWQNNHDAWIDQNGIHDYDNQRSVWIQKGEINFEHQLGGSMKHTGVILTNSENSNLNGAITIKGDEGFLLSTKNFTTNYWSEQGFSWGTNTAHYVSGSGILGFNNNITVSAGSTDDHSIAALIAGAIPSKNLGNVFGARAQPGVYIYGRNDSNKDHSFVDIKAPASIHLTTLDSYITIGDTTGSERNSDVSINSGNYLTVSADNSINITACSKTKADLMPRISLSEASTSISGDSITLNAKNYVTLLGSSVSVTGDFGVLGKKNAIVPTSRGMAAINAYETAEYYFGDIGETQTNSNGVVTVMIDPYFLETVNTLVPYQVFLTSYGDGNVWVSSRSANNFTVKSSNPNIHFAWEIKAKRKGYENDRMKIVKGVFNNEQY